MFLLSKNIAVIYISDLTLSVSEFHVRSDMELKNFHEIPLPTNVVVHGEIKDKAEFGKHLKKLFAEAPHPGILAKNAVLILPEQQMYMTVLHFTASKLPQEVLEEVPREAQTTIPLDPRNIYCDFFHVPAMEKRQEVMYVAADKRILDSYLEMCVSVGLQPLAIVTEPDSLLACSSAAADKTDASLILSIGKKRSYWIVSEAGSIKKIAPSKLISNVGNIASDDVVEMLQAEAQVVLSGFQATEEKHSSVKQILLWADSDSTGVLPTLAQRMSTLLHIDVKPISPRFPGKSSLLQKMYGALIVFQGISDKTKPSADLLPKRLKDQATLLLVNRFVTILSIMVMLAASGSISVFAYAWSEMYFENSRAVRESATGDHITADPGATRYMEIKKKTLDFNTEVDALIRVQSRLYSYHTIWESLRNIIFSEEIIATSIEFEAKDLAVRITGIARTRDDLARLQKKLETLPFVSEVISPLSNLDKTANVSFLFTVKLNPKTLPYLSN